MADVCIPNDYGGPPRRNRRRSSVASPERYVEDAYLTPNETPDYWFKNSLLMVRPQATPQESMSCSTILIIITLFIILFFLLYYILTLLLQFEVESIVSGTDLEKIIDNN